MPVHTEMRDDLENRYNESKKELDKAQWEKEQAKNAYEGAQNEYDFHEKEASGQWGNDIPPGNISGKRKELEAERDRKYDEYQKADDKEQIAKDKFEYDKENWETYQKYEDQMYSKDDDNDKSI